MPMERRGRVIRVIPTLVNRQREEPTGCDGERQLSMDGTSRVSREAQARICECLGVRFPGATRPATDLQCSIIPCVIVPLKTSYHRVVRRRIGGISIFKAA